jgi:WD40 repeat protein
MGKLVCMVLAALAAMCMTVAARPADKTSHVLRLVKEIGPGCAGDKFGWMAFVSFSADGKEIASDAPATKDDTSGDLTIWSFPKGRLIRQLPGRAWSISRKWKYYATHNSVRKFTDGRQVISLSDDTYVRFAFSPDGTYVAQPSGTADAQIRLIELASGKSIRAFGTHPVSSIAISPDGRTLAAGYWDFVALWDIRTGKRIATLRGFGRYVESLSFRRDGRMLAGGTDSGKVQVWDLRRRQRLFSIQLEGGETSEPAFSPDRKLLAVGTYGTGTVWLIDAHGGAPIDHQKVSDIGCGSAAFSPDGRYLITPSTGGLITWPYDRGGTIRVFRVVRR